MATGEHVLEALVLAAGAGRRFGGGKLTAPWRDGVLLDGALKAALAAPVRRVTLVTGHDADTVAAAARRLEPGPRLRVVHAERHNDGMGASLAAGVDSLAPDVDGVLVFLGDMPLIPAGIADDLVMALKNGAPAAVPVVDGRRGHPAAFARSQFPALAELRGDRGGTSILAKLGDAVTLVACPDSGVLIDVDQPPDLPA